MAISNADLQRLWDDAWDAAPAGEGTLRDQLRAFERDAGSLLKYGSQVNLSKNSASQTNSGHAPGNITTAEAAGAWRKLLNVFDRLHQDLIDAGTANPSDQQIYSAGVAYLLDEPTECRIDFSEARFAT